MSLIINPQIHEPKSGKKVRSRSVASPKSKATNPRIQKSKINGLENVALSDTQKKQTAKQQESDSIFSTTNNSEYSFIIDLDEVSDALREEDEKNGIKREEGFYEHFGDIYWHRQQEEIKERQAEKEKADAEYEEYQRQKEIQRAEEKAKKENEFITSGISILNQNHEFDETKILSMLGNDSKKSYIAEYFNTPIKTNSGSEIEPVIYEINNEIYMINCEQEKNGTKILAAKYNSEGIKTSSIAITAGEYGNILAQEEASYNEQGLAILRSRISFDSDGILEEEPVVYEIERNTDYANKAVDLFCQSDSSKACASLAPLVMARENENLDKLCNEAITENRDGSYSVYFKGIDYTANLTPEEVMKNAQSGKYVSPNSDIDVSGILLPALEKAIEYAEANNKDTTGHFSTKSITIERTNTLDNRPVETIFYMLTGKSSMTFSEKKGIEEALSDLEANKNSVVITTGFTNTPKGGIFIEDMEGGKLGVTTGHWYAIEDCTDETVTIVDPGDSSVKHTISKEVFYSYSPEVYTHYFSEETMPTQIKV